MHPDYERLYVCPALLATPSRGSAGKSKVPRRIYRGEGMEKKHVRDTSRVECYRKELYNPPIHPNCFQVWIESIRL
ncbi:hypothetical protein DV515_00004483 [Chloebia gouldiae]|uniref:Uncharacterized protein n=1 Tax=Chloebia gouldiae TaxID=44316 RepID=A0A3L8SRH7_CHLGU|nr:hypothetical protein DV515_00004483 [Chloebia gouldiae]